ncbi:MAG: accessory factor UbiK family protein [Alphaproteobacteria bacterium]
MQTNNRVFDELAALLTNAMGAAKGARDEVSLLLRQQGERIAGDLALASREEVEVAKELARQALARLDAIDERLASLEKRLESIAGVSGAPGGDRPKAE